MRHFLAPSRCLRMCEVFQQCQSVGAAACCASAGVRDIIPRPLQVCRHQQCQKWMTGCGSCCAVFSFYYYYFRVRAMMCWIQLHHLTLACKAKRRGSCCCGCSVRSTAMLLPTFSSGTVQDGRSWFCGLCIVVTL